MARPVFSLGAVERVAIANELSHLIVDFHELEVRPELFFGNEVAVCRRAFQLCHKLGTVVFLLGEKFLDLRIDRIVRHIRQQAAALSEQAVRMQRDDVAGIGVLLGETLDAVAIKIQPDFSAEMFDAADVVRRQSFAVELRFDFPIPPAGIVLLRCENHRGVWGRAGEIAIAPMGGKPTGDFRMIHLQNQQQLFLIVRANHHK
jgi:hypothetical protein